MNRKCKRLRFVSTAAAVLSLLSLGAGSALADASEKDAHEVPVAVVGDDVQYLVAEEPVHEVTQQPGYWIGVSIGGPASDDLRAHLNLPKGQGITVAEIVVDSPAEKAGLKEHDILLRANDKPLAEPQDLIDVVRGAKDTEITIELIRHGQPQELTLKPEERPGWRSQFRVRQLSPPESEGLYNFWRLAPGMVLRGPAVVGDRPITRRFTRTRTKLPDGMSVSVTKRGDEPARIVVKRGDDKWEVTEETIDELPDDVRPHVERMLPGGPGPFGLGFGDYEGGYPEIRRRVQEQARKTADQARRQAEEAARAARRLGGDRLRQIEDQLDKTNRRLEELLEQFRQMRKSRAGDDDDAAN